MMGTKNIGGSTYDCGGVDSGNDTKYSNGGDFMVEVEAASFGLSCHFYNH